MTKVFISYVRENAAIVDKLAAELRRYGVTVWLDREQLFPGMRWRQAIRKAIRSGDYFIVCFSAESVARSRTYQNEELVLAIEELRLRPTDRIWFIPVLLSECEIPDRGIGGGETLNSIQWAALYQNWNEGIERVLRAMGIEPFVNHTAAADYVEVRLPAKVMQVPELVGDLVALEQPIRLELVRIPDGEFLIGRNSDMDGKGRAKNGWDGVGWDYEVPQHKLALPEYYIGKTPITNAQYAAFVESAKKEGLDVFWRAGRSRSGEENHPVVFVTWYDAMNFCRWLSESTGYSFRLPTEAEWEKAARGDDGRIYPWGNKEPSASLCNFGTFSGYTTPVDRYPDGVSPYGVLDMSGNVWEWTSSLWGEDHLHPNFGYPYDSHDGREDLEAPEAVKRVVRGGSFGNQANDLRCAVRGRGDPDMRRRDFGFRVCAVMQRE